MKDGMHGSPYKKVEVLTNLSQWLYTLPFM